MGLLGVELLRTQAVVELWLFVKKLVFVGAELQFGFELPLPAEILISLER
jgi:hypothetical protein